MKLKGYRVLPNSLRSANVHKRAQKMLPKRLKSTITATNADEPSLEDKIDKLFSGQDLLFERLHTEPKWQRTRKVYKTGLSGAKRSGSYVRKQPIYVKLVAVIFVSLLAGGLYRIGPGSSTPSINEVAGVSNANSANKTDANETLTSKPSFAVFSPGTKNLSDLGGRERKSPSGDVIYSYADTIVATRIEVTQQPLPKSFNGELDKKVQELAADFNAPLVFQVNETTVYHGFSEKTKYQTLIFAKDGVLVFILSPEKLSDDVWVSYIISLAKN